MVENAEAKIYESVLSHPERFQAGLQVFGNEVWANEKLVTRYSEPVKQALWLPDNVHILIQLADSLHVVERTGGHDIILLAFAVDTPITRFAPLVGGEKLIIQSVGKLELLTITAPFGRVSPFIRSGKRLNKSAAVVEWQTHDSKSVPKACRFDPTSGTVDS